MCLYVCLNVFRSGRTCVETHVSGGQQQLGAALRGDVNNAGEPSRVVDVAARKQDVAIARIRRAVRSEEKRRGSRAWCKENRRATTWAAGIMEFELDGSLKEWAKDKPLSILQLDPADRAVLRIAGE